MSLPGEKHTAFPTLVQAALIVLALFLSEYVAMLALMDATGLRAEAAGMWGIATVLGNGIVFTLLLHIKKLSYSALFHSSPNSVGATLGILFIPIALLVPALVLTVLSVNAVVVFFFPVSRAHEVMFEQMTSSSVMSVITVCVLAPVLEEMLFRGIILRSFLVQYSSRVAILASAVLFGAAHLNMYQFLVGLLAGTLLGWLYQKTKSLWPCITLHALYNSTVSLYLGAGPGVRPNESVYFSPVVWLVAFGLAFAGGSALWVLLEARPVAADL